MYCFIPRSLLALKRVVAKSEHARFGATTGFRLAVDRGMVRVEVTDGKRLVVAQFAEPDKPAWPGFKEVADAQIEAIISFADLERGIKVCPIDKWRGASADLIGIASVGDLIHIGAGENCVLSRQIEGRFPNVDAVIPKQKPLFSFRVDPKLMAEQMLALHDVSSTFKGESVGVDLFFYGTGIPIGFCATNVEQGMLIEGLLVPLTGDRPTLPKPPAPLTAEEKAAAERAKDLEELEELRSWRGSIEDDGEIDASTRIVALKEWDEEHGADLEALEAKFAPETNDAVLETPAPEAETKPKRGKKPKIAAGT